MIKYEHKDIYLECVIEIIFDLSDKKIDEIRSFCKIHESWIDWHFENDNNADTCAKHIFNDFLNADFIPNAYESKLFLSLDGELKIVRYGKDWFLYKKTETIVNGKKIRQFGNSVYHDGGIYKSKKYKCFDDALKDAKKYIADGLKTQEREI